MDKNLFTNKYTFDLKQTDEAEITSSPDMSKNRVILK
jgi:hypothetical protein